MSDMRDLLRQLEEQAGAELDVEPALCYLAVSRLGLDEEEVRGAARRALLVLAAGGDPTRELDAGDPAVARFATDLVAPARIEALVAALREIAEQATAAPRVAATARALADQPGDAWHLAAAALLADHLIED